MTRNSICRAARLVCTAVLALLCAATAAPAQTRDKVVVASKIDTEGALLGNMILIALEKAGVPVENRLQLGPSKIVRTALVSGEVDLYPEYTGNGAFFFNKESDPAWKQAQPGYDLVRRERLSTMDDFAQLAKRGGVIKLAGSAEFVESPAALPSFEKTYAFNLPRDQIVVLPGGDTAVTMRAAAQQVSGVNAAMVYGTDGAIAALDLVVMEDTKGAQVVYEPAPVVRQAVLDKYPIIRPTLSRIFATLTLNQLQALNAQVAVEGQPPRDVAAKYLQQKGLIR